MNIHAKELWHYVSRYLCYANVYLVSYVLCHITPYYDKYVSDAVKVDQSHSPGAPFERFGVKGKKFDPS